MIMVGTLRNTLIMVFGVLLLAAFGLLFMGRSQTVSAEGPPLCPTGNSIVEPGPGDEMRGVEELRAFVDIPGMNVAEVKFKLEPNIFVGEADRIGGSDDWEYEWDTTNRNNGPYGLYAIAFFDGGFNCRTHPRNIVVDNQNTVSTHLEIFIQPGGTATFEPQVTVPIQVHALLFDNASGNLIEDVTENLEPDDVTWSTSIGSFTPNSPTPFIRNFFTGPNEGDGEIEVEVNYNGHVRIGKTCF